MGTSLIVCGVIPEFFFSQEFLKYLVITSTDYWHGLLNNLIMDALFAHLDVTLLSGSIYLTLVGNHYSNKSHARSTCLNLPTSSGEFDLAILDTLTKVNEVKTFMSTLPTGIK